jgi:hypothetical protein
LEYSDYHVALAFVLTVVSLSRDSHSLALTLLFLLPQASQDLFDQESIALPSDLSKHLGGILFPFPKCDREDIPIVESKAPLLPSLLSP